MSLRRVTDPAILLCPVPHFGDPERSQNLFVKRLFRRLLPSILAAVTSSGRLDYSQRVSYSGHCLFCRRYFSFGLLGRTAVLYLRRLSFTGSQSPELVLLPATSILLLPLRRMFFSGH